MKLGGGRSKGSAFERTVAKQVIAAFAEFGITGEDCYRTPMSGGHRFANKSDPGDLLISKKLAKIFSFAIECKTYRSVPFAELLQPRTKGTFVKWWAQAKKATANAPNSRLKPLVVFKQNASTVFAIVPDKTVHVDYFRIRCRTWIDGECVLVVHFSSLLNWCVKAARLQNRQGKG